MRKGLLTAALLLAGCNGEQQLFEKYLKDERLRLSVHKECQAQPPTERQAPDCQAARAAHEHIALNIVRDELKDPESAQFQDVFSAWDTEACGYVNAKNSYGGYVGKRLFHVDVARKAVSISPSDGSANYIAEMCLSWTRHDIARFP